MVEAYHHLRHPEPVGSNLMISVAVVAVLMNTVIAYALMDDAKHSLNSRAAFIHMAGDALSSVAVVIAGVIVHFTDWVYADPAVSLLIALFILYSAWGIVSDATDILMESTPKDVDIDKVVTGIKSVDPVCDVHDLHVWTVGDGLHCLSCHVALPATCSFDHCATVIKAINQKLHDDFNIGHATIQTEIEGRCGMKEDTDLYCTMENHNMASHNHKVAHH